MKSAKIFNCCPSCGAGNISFDGIKEFNCKACSFVFFQDVAAAVAVILECDRKIILTKRAKEPGKGKLDLPGGFVDPGENAEGAAKREVKEELKIEIDAGALKYLGSHPNIYEYKGVSYHTCDLFFYTRIDRMPADFDRDEIAELILINPADIPDDEIAFASIKKGLDIFKCSKFSVKGRSR